MRDGVSRRARARTPCCRPSCQRVASRRARRPGRAASGADSRHLRALRRPRRDVDRAVRRTATAPASRLFHQPVRLAVPAGVGDGARFRFRVSVAAGGPGARRSARRDPSGRLRSPCAPARVVSRDRPTSTSSASCSSSGACSPRSSACRRWRSASARSRSSRRRATAAAADSFAAGLTAAAFTALAVIAMLWGVAHIVVGVPLRRRAPLGATPRADARLDRSAAAAVRHRARLLRALGAAERGREEAVRRETGSELGSRVLTVLGSEVSNPETDLPEELQNKNREP